MSTALPARLIRVFLSELEERLRTFDADLIALEKPGTDDERAETVKRLFRDAHSLKGAAASVGASGIEVICQQLEDVLAKVRDGALQLDAERFATFVSGSTSLRQAARELAGSAADAVAPAPAAEALPKPAPSIGPTGFVALEDKTLRVPASAIDALMEQSGELLVAHHRADDLLRDILDLRSAVGRVDVNELNRSLECIAAAMQAERVLLRRASAELDEGLRAIRLVPFGTACEGLDRVVRDVAISTGKRARLEIIGSNVGVDRVMVERLRDPLVQLIRNAVGHGLETPEERKAAGKPAEGSITLTVRPNARNVEITVTDDGRGLDLESLRRRVRERGLDFDQEDLSSAVFLPGISTAAEVTNLSGRGVGLDVVRAELEALSGSAEVTSTQGAGTTFTLNFPLTITTLRAILVAAGDHVYGLNIPAVERVLRIDDASVTSVEGRRTLLIDGAAVPIVSLSSVLGVDPRADGEPQRIALLIRRGGRAVALTVDELIDERDVHLRSLGARLIALPFISGAAIMGDGSIAMVLRTRAVVDAALNAARNIRNAATLLPVESAVKRVLLVDDSVTTRTLERSILEAAGYEVVTAADGEDAWTLLGQQSVDVVVSDVDMPRMNGFALAETIRGSNSLRELPIVLVTARANEADRQRGLEAGADAYIVKGSFRQEELLETIASLV